MRNNIVLTEKDLFNYVFFKKKIKEEKLQILEDSRFEFYTFLFKNLKESLKENLSGVIKNKIKLSIKCYHPSEKISLYLIKGIKSGRRSEKSSFSKKGKKIVSQYTYAEKDNIYLIRVINFEESANIYLFSIYEENINNVIITTYPAGESFKIASNMIPVEVEHQIAADRIEIKFL